MGTDAVIPSQVCSLFIENSFQISKRNPTKSTQKSSTTIPRVHEGENSPERQLCLKNAGKLTVSIFGQVLSRQRNLHRNFLCCSDFPSADLLTYHPPCHTTSTNPKSIPMKPGDLTFHFDCGGIGSSRLLPPSSPVLAKAFCLRDEGTKRVFFKAIGVFK